MINWLKKILGIFDLEKIIVCQHQAINRIEKKLHIAKPSQRYDEIERARSRRRKAGLRK